MNYFQTRKTSKWEGLLDYGESPADWEAIMDAITATINIGQYEGSARYEGTIN